MQTAKAWGLTPGQWDALRGEERAEMLAHDMHDGLRSAWHHDQLRKQQDRWMKQKGPGGGGETVARRKVNTLGGMMGL